MIQDVDVGGNRAIGTGRPRGFMPPPLFQIIFNNGSFKVSMDIVKIYE